MERQKKEATVVIGPIRLPKIMHDEVKAMASKGCRKVNDQYRYLILIGIAASKIEGEKHA